MQVGRTGDRSVSGCTPQLEFDAAASIIVTNGRIPIQKVYKLPLVKESFSLITEMVVRSTVIGMAMSDF